MSTPDRPRVALCGISLESNAFSPVAGETDFRALCYLEGEELLAAARGEVSTVAMEMSGFVGAMDVTGPWEPVPLLFTASHPWGPVRQDFFDRALIESRARGVLYGSWHDPALVADALAAGEGASMTAVFNRDPKTAFAERLEVPARVVRLSSAPFAGRLGIYAGREVRCQPSCALELGGEGGIFVVAISNRYQTADPMFFEHLGLDIAAARTVCVKSRGHFRAGFAPWFPPERVVEVDTAGLTSPVLERLEWKGLPRPVYPLDEDTDWVPPNW